MNVLPSVHRPLQDRAPSAESTQPDLFVSVLGAVRVVRNGNDVALGPKVQRLLAGLIVECGSVVASSRLIYLVWGDNPPAAAERSIKTYIARLRTYLGRDVGDRIVFRNPGYVLELGPDELDSEAFERSVDRAQVLLGEGHVTQAICSFEEALGYWRGRAFDGFAEADWAQPTAIRLEERRTVARVELARARMHLGDVDRALAEAQQIVESCPLRERPREVLAHALYLTGQQVEALRVLEEYRLLLSTEFGLEVSTHLQDLGNRIARRDPTLASESRDLEGYELFGRLGTSTRAVVYRARQRALGREVVVKVSCGQTSPSSLEYSLEREAKMGALVEHRNAMPIYDFGRTTDGVYLVTRLFRGGSLRDQLERVGPLSHGMVYAMLNQLADVLSAVHDAGLVHLGVEPRNIMLDGDGGYFLKGFGSAQFLSTASWTRGDGIQSDVTGLSQTISEALTGRPTGNVSAATIGELVEQLGAELRGGIAEAGDCVTLGALVG